MNKRNLFSLVFISLLATILFVSCNNEKEKGIEGISGKNSYFVNFEKDGFDVVIKSVENKIIKTKSPELSVQYIISVSMDGIKADAILVKQNIDDKNYTLHHYSMDQHLIATLIIKDNKVVDIILFNNLVETRGYTDCVKKEYKKFKDFYNQGDNLELACDLANIFAGACTVAGALQAGVRCMF